MTSFDPVRLHNARVRQETNPGDTLAPITELQESIRLLKTLIKNRNSSFDARIAALNGERRRANTADRSRISRLEDELQKAMDDRERRR